MIIRIAPTKQNGLKSIRMNKRPPKIKRTITQMNFFSLIPRKISQV